MRGKTWRAEYRRWQIIAGCWFFANYKLLQRPPATAGLLFFFSHFHANALVRDTEASNVYFSTPSPTTSSPSPGFLGLEEVHIKGELRRIHNALPDLVVPENPIKHHHSWLHSPVIFYFLSLRHAGYSASVYHFPQHTGNRAAWCVR